MSMLLHDYTTPADVRTRFGPSRAEWGSPTTISYQHQLKDCTTGYHGCDSWNYSGWACYLELALLRTEFAGEACDDCGARLVPLFEDMHDCPVTICPTHGRTRIDPSRSGSYSGFAGGRCTYILLECGCTEVDESADLRAAY